MVIRAKDGLVVGKGKERADGETRSARKFKLNVVEGRRCLVKR